MAKVAKKEVMLGVPEEQETIELLNHRAMVEFPEESVEVTLDIKVFHNGELINVRKTMPMSEIRTAFQKADDGYIDDDDEFVITEKGLQWLEENRERQDSGYSHS